MLVIIGFSATYLLLTVELLLIQKTMNETIYADTQSHAHVYKCAHMLIYSLIDGFHEIDYGML